MWIKIRRGLSKWILGDIIGFREAKHIRTKADAVMNYVNAESNISELEAELRRMKQKLSDEKAIPRTVDAVVMILEKYQDIFSSRSIVNQLSSVDVTDYERGVVAGKIQLLSKLMMDIAHNDKTKTTK